MKLEELISELQSLLERSKTEELSDVEIERCDELNGLIEAASKREEVLTRSKTFVAPAVNFIRTRNSEDITEEQAEFRSAFMSGRLSDIAELRSQSSSTTAGGYTIPASFRQKLVDRKLAFGGIASLGEQISTSDWTSIPFPTLDDTSNTAEIVAENGSPASAGADLTFDTKSLDVYRLVASGASNTWLKIPFQLLDSSYLSFETLVANKLGERLGRKEAAYAATGSGSGEPQGLLTGLTSSAEIANNTTGISYSELIDAEHAVDIAYRDMGNCVWVMNDGIWKLVKKTLDGNDRPLYMEQQVSGGSRGTSKMLLGYPVVIDNSLPSTWGDQAKTIIFGDIREAFVVRRVNRGLQVFSDPLQFALAGQIGMFAADGFGSLVQNPNAATCVSGKNV